MSININIDTERLLQKAKDCGYLDGFDFSIVMQNLLISKGGYIIDTGNYENVNAAATILLAEKIRKHPLLWKIFFMVG